MRDAAPNAALLSDAYTSPLCAQRRRQNADVSPHEIAFAPPPTLLRARRLEHLHKIARGIFDQDLPAARPGDDFVAEPDAGLPECLYLSLKVAASHDNPIPAAGFRLAPVRHWLGTTARAFRWTQHKLQVLSPKERKVRTRLCRNAKPQVLRIKGNRRVDVIDDVADHEWVEVHDTPFMGRRSQMTNCGNIRA